MSKVIAKTVVKPFATLVAVLLLTLSSALSLADAPLVSFGATAARMPFLPFTFTVVNWNIYKGSKAEMARDFAHITKDADVAVIQEAQETTQLIQDLSSANQEFFWNMVRGFKFQGVYTGVATGSRVAALRIEGFLTNVREPILNSPKSMLLSVYPLANSLDSLAVLNVHGINFVLNSKFKKQITQMVALLKDHRGPIVVTGDFNTWNKGRMKALDKGLGSLGLQRLHLKDQDSTDNEGAHKGLDHAYVRGLVATEAVILNSIKSSDHKPILLRLGAQ